MSQFPQAVCKFCANRRMRPKPELFSASDLHNPQVLKAQLEWEQQDQQRKFTELQRFEEGRPFNYEPYHYYWCEAFTPLDPELIPQLETMLSDGDTERARELAKESNSRGRDLVRRAQAGDWDAVSELAKSGRATMDPVTGEIAQFYALCDQMNPEGQCPLFEPKRT